MLKIIASVSLVAFLSVVSCIYTIGIIKETKEDIQQEGFKNESLKAKMLYWSVTSICVVFPIAICIYIGIKLLCMLYIY